MSKVSKPNAHDVLTVLTAPALVCAPGGEIIGVNEAAANWLGTSDTAASGQNLSELLDTPSESLFGFMQRSQHRGHSLCQGHVYRRRDRVRQFAMSCQAQRLSGLQQSHCLLLTFTNAASRDPGPSFTDAREDCSPLAVNNLGRAESSLERLDTSGGAALSDVALGLVHEVNQPLTAIGAYAGSCRRWLSEGLTDHPKLLPTIDKIIEQVQVTGQMINSLKGLVRGEDDERRPCDLNQLVGESLALLSLDPRIEHCVIESQLNPNPCPVIVSPAQIKIVLLNLLRNGLEASLASDAAESRVCVSVSMEEDNWASATIRDSGAGVTQEGRKLLFEPFGTSKSNGLGLGLLISRCLATAHAGRVEYKPSTSPGAAFQLLLPLAN